MLATKCGGISSRTPLLVWICFSLALRSVLGRRSAATVSDPPKQQIRIAVINDDSYYFASVRYLITHMNNSNRTLLPDFDVVVEEYRSRPMDGGVLCFIYGCEGGAIGTAAQELIRVLSDQTPLYHAIVGPFLEQAEVLSIVDLTAAANVLHVHGGQDPKLSDRTRYPYSFRSTRSIEAEPAIFLHVCYLNEWWSVVSIWNDPDMLDAARAAAARKNMTVYTQLSTPGESDLVLDSWQTVIVNLVRSTRIRPLIASIGSPPGIRLVCRLIRAQTSGMQLFVQQTWPFEWWLYDRYGCTGDELNMASRSHINTGHILTAPGVQLPGLHNAVKLPSQADVPLGCIPHITPDIFYNSGELMDMGVEEGWVSHPALIQSYNWGASRAVEAVCGIVMALHDAIYNKHVSVTNIEQRDHSTFHTLAGSMMEVDFQAPGGQFRYYENTGDPEYVWFSLTMFNVPDQSPLYGVAVAGMTFPDGPAGDPALQVSDEVNRPFIWSDGSVGVPQPHLALFPDCGLANGVLVWQDCEPCPPGTFYEEALLTCRTCPSGQFQNESGRSTCEIAPLGTYIANLTHPSESQPCPIGHECPQVGTISPQRCAQGRFAEEVGQSSCTLCPTGTYQNAVGASNCTSCAGVLIGAVTAQIASTSSSQCICPQGSLKELGVDVCSSCPEGLECFEGSDMQNWLQGMGSLDPAMMAPFPHAVRGYMTTVEAPLKVYKCAEEEHCPGGPPGTCAARRDPSSVACGDCLSGSYENGKDCVECGNAGAMPMVLTGLLAAAMVSVATLLVNKDVHKTPAASIMIVAVSGLLFLNLQTMGIFSSIDVPWQQPLKTLLRLTRVLSFDLELLQVGCVVGVNPVRSFALRQFVALLVIPFICATLLVKKYCVKPQTRVIIELSNALGTLYSIFFISVVISAVEPFMCYKHPNDNGESVQSASSLLCFEGGDHSSMATIGAIALFVVPVPFLCVCMYGIIVYPRKMRLHTSSQYLHATRFLFFRYVPERYYFQIVVLMRGFLLCIIPAAMRDGLATQVLFITIILLSYGMLVLSLRPWRVDACNILDCLLTNLLVVLMTIGALYIEDTPQRDALAVLSTVVFMAIIVGGVLALAKGLYMRFAPQCFNYFICHHKGHAAAQARYIKVLLLKKRRTLKVFIDSDDLTELDGLFDIVKSRVRHLIVLLTAETLTRPWCAGEVVTAVRGEIPITKLMSSTFAGLAESQINSPELYVDSSGCNLKEYGIQWEDVTHAFTVLLSSATKKLDLLDSLQGTWRFEHAIAGLLNLKEDDAKVNLISEAFEGGILVVTDTASDEATAAAGILVDRIAPEVYRIMDRGIHLLCNFDHNEESAVQAAQKAIVTVVILSPGCLQSPSQVKLLCGISNMSTHHDASALISINIPGFSFPTPAGIVKLCEKLFPSASMTENQKTSEHLNSFFRRISLLYPTHASQEAIDTQSDEIFRRIKQNRSSYKAKGAGSRPNESSSKMTPTDTSGTEPGSPATSKLDQGGSKGTSAAFGTASTASSKGGLTSTDELNAGRKGLAPISRAPAAPRPSSWVLNL